MKELDLAQPAIAWHTIRDTIAESAVSSLVTGTLGKLAMDVKLMMQTEVGEVYEPFAHGRGSSSTMPQKRNPISSCYIHACAGVVRQQVAALLDAMVADHERSTGHGRSMDALPSVPADRWSAEPGEVGPRRTRGRCEAHAGQPGFYERPGGFGGGHDGSRPVPRRERAHDLVYDLCREAIRQDRPLLGSSERERRHHKARRSQEAHRALRPVELPRLSGVMVDRVLERMRSAHIKAD